MNENDFRSFLRSLPVICLNGLELAAANCRPRGLASYFLCFDSDMVRTTS